MITKCDAIIGYRIVFYIKNIIKISYVIKTRTLNIFKIMEKMNIVIIKKYNKLF